MVALVERYLSLSLFRNAIFLGERLVAAFPSARNVHLLATCFYRSGKPGRAFSLLSSRNSTISVARGDPNSNSGGPFTGRDDVAEEASRYLLALCGLEIGKLKEAENALLSSVSKKQTERGERSLGPSDISEEVLSEEKCPVANGAAGLYLLGKICLKDNRHEHAIEYFALALKLDAFMWDAYEQLCALGADVPPTAFFGISGDSMDGNGNDGRETPVTAPLPLPTPLSTTVSGIAAEEPYQYVAVQPNKPSRKSTRGSSNSNSHSAKSPSFRLTPTKNRGWATPAPALTSRSLPFDHLSLHDDTLTPKGKRKKRPFSSKNGKTRRHHSREDHFSEDEAPLHVPNAVSGSMAVLSLLRKCGEALLLLTKYQCKEAIRAFKKLPACHLNTGWTMHRVGRAYFELANYEKARDAFQKMIRCDPFRIEGLDIYSTNLWHLKKEAELCYLAQSAVRMDMRAPETWIVVGNCFALQKEHDVAIKFFKRSLQLDRNFTYAHTLSGHEYVSNEDFEKAVACYRHSIRLDPRHYNAWYGLGTIYYRQEKYELAEYHFRRALDINPRSSVLYCYLGMVLHSSGKCEEALTPLQAATEIEPRNPQARYQKAAVLRSMGHHADALEELRRVNDYAPREASVYFLMGKICKQMGDIDSALTHFNTALDLDPKDSNLIKTAIDKLDSADNDEDDAL